MKTSTLTSPAYGFTFLELMVGIVLLVIVLGLGVPSFNGLIQTSAIASSNNGLITAINITRSEAIKRHSVIEIRPISANWNLGWRIWQDRNGNSAIDADEVLREFSAISDRVTLTSTATQLRFSSRGNLLDTNSITFTLTPQECNGEDVRQISVPATGRPALTRETCP